MKSVLAFDIGGTHFRYAVVQTGHLAEVGKLDSPSFVRFPDKSGEQLVSELIEVICATISDVRKRHPSIAVVGVAFPGMVTPQGVALKSPPLWGDRISRIALKALIQRRTELGVAVFNDLCGTALFYSELPEFAMGADFLTVVTLSTGIGCKTVDLRRRRILVDSGGRCGEIGHVTVDHSEDALPCDCGGKGHLSSYLSGRGMLRLIRHMTSKRPSVLQLSPMGHTLDEKIAVQNFVQALERNEELAWEILDFAATKLAHLIEALSATFGIDRYVLVGGLSFALGENLRRCLNRHLIKTGIFGWDEPALCDLVRIGIANDDIGLLGAAEYTLRVFQEGDV